jgi:superfamily II DNA/RNA helicase
VTIDSSTSKIAKLNELLKQDSFEKVLVFGRTKRGVERLGRELYNQGYKVASIHGDKPQYQRQQAIRMFKEDVVNILVATDVAARGLDISNITHVINYDPPQHTKIIFIVLDELDAQIIKGLHLLLPINIFFVFRQLGNGSFTFDSCHGII